MLLVGIFMAVKALEQRAHAAVLNCHSLNTYVSSALSDWGKQCMLAAKVPRQLSPAAATANAAAGTSSFGMSGTNAHLLVSVPFTPSPATAPTAIWKRARCKPIIFMKMLTLFRGGLFLQNVHMKKNQLQTMVDPLRELLACRNVA